MYAIRPKMFETNSSSVDVLVIPNDASVGYPKEIKLSTIMRNIYSLDENPSIEDKLAFMYNKAENNGSPITFINWLRSKGITITEDIPNDFNFDNYMFGEYIEENELAKFLFSPEAKYYDHYQDVDSNDYDVITIRY